MNNQPTRCLLIDDEFFALEVIEQFLNRMDNMEVVGKMRNPLAAFQLLQTQTVDLLFLDINMPQINGMVLLENLANKPTTIFTTAYTEFAYKAFELDAADYLVKPFSFERFQKGVEKALALKKPVAERTIKIRSDRSWHHLNPASILYAEGWKEYLRIHTTDKLVVALMTFTELEEQLSDSGFVRIHKSYLVNRAFVSSFNHQHVLLDDKITLPIARNRKASILSLLQ